MTLFVISMRESRRTGERVRQSPPSQIHTRLFWSQLTVHSRTRSHPFLPAQGLCSAITFCFSSIIFSSIQSFLSSFCLYKITHLGQISHLLSGSVALLEREVLCLIFIPWLIPPRLVSPAFHRNPPSRGSQLFLSRHILWAFLGLGLIWPLSSTWPRRSLVPSRSSFYSPWVTLFFLCFLPMSLLILLFWLFLSLT